MDELEAGATRLVPGAGGGDLGDLVEELFGVQRAWAKAREALRDFDEETFRDGHHPDAVTVFANGAVRYGLDAIMAALRSHFENRNAIWSWTELYRVVDGCKVRVHFLRHDLRDPVRRVPAARADRRHACTIDQVRIHVDGDTALVSAPSSRQHGPYSRDVDTHRRHADGWRCVYAFWPLAG
jgi:hypothetical protein